MSEGLKVGSKFSCGNSMARVMAIAEGWVMARRRGCMPFVVKLDEIELETKTDLLGQQGKERI